ncbi:DUF3320 domain-containing protein [Gluconobacter morbifer]|uniref:Disulfide oxidoreductase n=1 Tax=Gluconobacter morbifer G707 TaxID=1088869 RepID=G6XMM8_9PROT|nr:DUF3320 domain-containing protein [Gluconobacter morbifer]EHH66981.1 hypothetical protein GMO_27460 [Gluconobacter morbifer G707]
MTDAPSDKTDLPDMADTEEGAHPSASVETDVEAYAEPEHPAPAVELTVALRETISSALWENHVPVLLELAVRNGTDRDISQLEITLCCEPPVIQTRSWRLQSLGAGQFRAVDHLDVELDGAFLAALSEGTRAEVHFTVSEIIEDGPRVELASVSRSVRVLCRSDWGGLAGLPDLLAAFALPNDPAVGRILRSASALLEKAGQSPALEGYQGSKKRVWEQAQAIWCAIAELKLTYVNPPASFVENGQRVRLPSQIVEERLATCLDTTLLFTACLEAIGLRPLLVMTRGHALAGLWLSREESGTTILQDLPGVRNRLALDDICVFETTLVALPNCPDFARGCAVGRIHLEDDGTFEEVIDIHRARLRKIRPLSQVRKSMADPVEDEAVASPAPPLLAAPDLREENRTYEMDETPAGRLERWCTRLLDISGRSRLLNLPKSEKQLVEFAHIDASALEDRLAAMREGDGRPALRLRARPELMDGSDPRSAALHQERHSEDRYCTLVAEGLEHGEILVGREEAALQTALTELYRKARAAEQEGGANILFLTVGELLWEPRGRERQARAPLVLVPVVLERSSVNAPFRLRSHTDESRINGSLLEVLRQDFGMRFPEFEGELPQDESGLDVRRILDIFRARLRDQSNWEVVERVCLTTLSFAKFLMWKDLQERQDSLRVNPVAVRLLDGVSAEDGADHPFPAASFEASMDGMDQALEQAGLVCPMEADSSQMAAVARAAAGENFVLIGPPGTGKSQTIANIIADTLARGKTVLFVAEKRTALEVVRNRLKAVGLGEFCLDLFSPQAGRGAVFQQFQAVQNACEQFSEGDWTQTQARLAETRRELNAYVHDLHRRWPNGWTPYRAIGVLLEAERRATPRLTMRWDGPAAHDATGWERLQETASALGSLYERFGQAVLTPHLVGIEQEDWTSRWQENLLQQARVVKAALEGLERSSEEMFRTLGLTGEDRSQARLERVASLCSLLLRPEAGTGVWALQDDAAERVQAVLADRTVVAEYEALEAQLVVTWKDIAALPAADLLRDWQEASGKWLLARKSGQKAVKRRLEDAAGSSALPEDLTPELERLVALGELEKRLFETTHAEVVGLLWAGRKTDFGRIEAELAWGQELRAALAGCVGDIQELLTLRRQVRDLLTEGRDLLGETGMVGRQIAAFQTALAAVQASVQTLSELAASDMMQTVPDGPDWMQRLGDRMKDWQEQGRNLRDWCAWRRVCHDAGRVGLEPLVTALLDGCVGPDSLQDVLEASYAQWWLPSVVDQEPTLRGFVAATHEDRIERFRTWDKEASRMASALIRARLLGTVPGEEVRRRDAQYVLIHRETQKKARQMPIRKLASDAPRAIRTLTPCLMMSPLSVAQYLPPGSEPFDLVIFDEASQIPTWDAIGAIGRGRQVIVVGDPKQLPPTSFFSRNETEDENPDQADMESILDECRAAGVPEISLKWHYRSRHESLIAFSNMQYYGGELITFPSTVTQDRAVSFRFVEDGNYQRGGARTNPAEARAVVAEVLRLLRLDDGRSVGVVTFNAEQQNLITDLLDRAQSEDAALVRFFGIDAAEPVFVRNLENVQGEERDVMLFSLTYAPELKGAPYVSFGPLNRVGGERRLNVAVTRARQQLIVFGSLRAEQIDPGRSSALGVSHLRKFLAFAEHGAGALAGLHEGSVGDYDSRFEMEVAAMLRERGWEVRPQIGVSRFRIDLGIVDPDQAGTFLAGVECDGATYHSSATAQDRDRLRQAVLETLGWTILRVWSTDWWLNAEREVVRLDQALTGCLEAMRLMRAEEAASADGSPPMEEAPEIRKVEEILPEEKPLYARFAGMSGETPNAEVMTPPVRNAATVDAARFGDDEYLPVLETLIRATVAQNGPVHESVLVQQISKAHGFARAGRQIRERILQAVPSDMPRTVEDAGCFFWENMPAEDEDFHFPTILAGKSVDPALLPLEILVRLAREQKDKGLDEESALQAMRKACGLGRMGAATRERLRLAWEKA